MRPRWPLMRPAPMLTTPQSVPFFNAGCCGFRTALAVGNFDQAGAERTWLRLRLGIDSHLPGFAVKLEMKAVGEYRLQHQTEFGKRCRSGRSGLHVIALRF